jgi:hypothetical protein
MLHDAASRLERRTQVLVEGLFEFCCGVEFVVAAGHGEPHGRCPPATQTTEERRTPNVVGSAPPSSCGQ